MVAQESVPEISLDDGNAGMAMFNNPVDDTPLLFDDFTISPRLRLRDRIDKITASCASISKAELLEHSPADRLRLQMQNQMAFQRKKCEHFGACLACTLNPCFCESLPTLQLSHRLYVITHGKEVLRTTATGKLLLLLHPKATLLVSGVPEHDAEIQRLCRLKSAVLLFPAADACSPAELLKPAASSHASSSDGGASSGATSAGTSDSASAADAAPMLDLIVLDGTWNQARWLYRTLPSNLRSVAVDCSNVRSLFGTRVRKQGVQREEAGRVSTLEAYAFLALALGDDASEVAKLGFHLEAFCDALPRQRYTPQQLQQQRESARGEQRGGAEIADGAGTNAAGADAPGASSGGASSGRRGASCGIVMAQRKPISASRQSHG